MAVCNPQSVEKQTTLPETEQPADNVVAHAISAGIPATSLPAVLVLAEADTMTSVAQWADMQQKRERALPINTGKFKPVSPLSRRQAIQFRARGGM